MLTINPFHFSKLETTKKTICFKRDLQVLEKHSKLQKLILRSKNFKNIIE